MATQLSKTIDETTEQVVSVVDQAQEAAISVVANVSKTVANYLPDLGIGEALLTPEEAVETSFRAGGRFIDSARSAALGFVGAVAPITEKVLGTKKSSTTPSKVGAVAKSA